MDPAPFDIPADLDTPVSAFLKLAPLRPRFLLESVEGGEKIGRYSFLGFGDAEEIRVEARPGEDLLSILREALASSPRLAPLPRALPFTGGLVGAVAFDATRRLERLPTRAARRAGEADALFLAPSSVLVFDHLTRRAALLHSGDEGERRALRKDVISALHAGIPPQERPWTSGVPSASLDRKAFADGVARAHEAIGAGEVFQLVLSIRFSARCGGSPFSVYRALRRLNPSPYTFFLRFSDTTLIGSSPEALVRLEGREAELRPIAGTRPRGLTAEQDEAHERELLGSAKEAAEHVMLVDLARNDLGRVAVPGSIAVAPYRSVERYSHVMHLVSGVRGVLAPDRDAFDLFAAGFPAGTVTGAPKLRAMELIDAIEPAGRGFYAGSVGYFGHGGAVDQAITIRTIVVRDDEVSFQAGAGIVADSEPAEEYDEVLSKSAALREALRTAAEVA